MFEAFDGGDWQLARMHYEEYIKQLPIEEHLAIWSLLDSRQRAYLKDEDRKYLKP